MSLSRLQVMEEVTKCRYIDCVDTREKEQILHELPVCDTGLCVRWLINSGHVDLIGSDLDALRSMKFFICNNHFTEDCYLSKGTLKEDAVPSPHWSTVSRTLRNLKIRRKVQLNGQESSMEEVATGELAEKNAPSEFEVDQWCRTCATKKQNLVSMTTKGKGTDMSLLSKLKLLIEIDDEDALPTKMCDECVDKLEQSFKFFQQIYVADNTLRHVFPNTRSSSTPRKPLYSIGEHMRNEQIEREKEKEREREKEKEKEKEKEEEQQQSQFQDRAPKLTRGIFRRGRGRPRTRGYAARARARQRSAQIAISVPGPNLINDNTTYESRANETTVLRNEIQSAVHDEERQCDTVFSLLTDTCHSDEELDWSDVLKVMSDQRYQLISKQKMESKLEENTQKETEEKEVVGSKVMSQLETTETSKDETLKEKTSKEETSKGETSKGETSKGEMSKGETSKGETSKGETSKGETSKEETSKAETSKGETKTEIDSQAKLEIEVQSNVTKLSTDNNIQRMHCEFCNEPFKLRRQLQTHLLTDHSQLSGYMCIDCLTCYESESLLSKHRSLRHGDRRYRCEHCRKEFPEKKLLREHINKCQIHDTTHYSCDFCGLAFFSKQDLVEHVKTHSDNSTISFHGSDVEISLKDNNELTSSSKPVIAQFEPESEYSSITFSNSIITSDLNPDEKNSSVVNSSGTIEINPVDETQGVASQDDSEATVTTETMATATATATTTMATATTTVATAAATMTTTTTTTTTTSSSTTTTTTTTTTPPQPQPQPQPTPTPTIVTTCPDCNEQMQDTVELSIHRMRRHSLNRKDATCLLCDNKSFSSLEEYEQHVLDHCKRLRISP